MEAEITSSENYGTGQKSQGQYISGKFSQQVSIMNDTQQEEPEDPEADVVDDEDDNTGNCQAADEGYSEEYYLQAPGDHQHQVNYNIMGRNSRPSAQLQMASQFTEEDVANENEEQTQNTFHKYHQGGIVENDPREKELFQNTQ